MELSPVIYNRIIDPLLASSRDRIIKHIAEGSRVIDIASGTGELVFDMAVRSSDVTGVDIEDTMINFAMKRQNGFENKNISFLKADVRQLDIFQQGSFDLATMSMALHQFDPSDWPKILKEVFRIAGKLLILDYSNPLPVGFKKSLVFIVERIAGRAHSRNFRIYNREGGVIPIVESYNYKCTHYEISGSGIFSLYHIELANGIN